MYQSRAQVLAEQTALLLVSMDENYVPEANWANPAFKNAKLQDKAYRRALLDVGAISARTAVLLGWQFESMLRREVLKLQNEWRKEMKRKLDATFARIGAKIGYI